MCFSVIGFCVHICSINLAVPIRNILFCLFLSLYLHPICYLGLKYRMFLSGWDINFIGTSGMIDYVDYKNCVRNSWIFSGVIFIPNWQEAGIEYRDSNYRVKTVHMSNGNTFQIVLTKTVPHRGLINYFRTNYWWTLRTLHGSLWMDAFLLNGMYIENILILEEMSDDALIFVPKRLGMNC